MRARLINNKKTQSQSGHPFTSFINQHNILSAIIICITLWVFWGLYNVQIIEGRIHHERMNSMHSGRIQNSSQIRGDIFFTYKDGSRMLVATDSKQYSVIINNRNITNELLVRKTLHDVGMHSDLLEQILKKTNDPYEVLAKKIPQDVAQSLIDKRIPGIEIHEQSERVYPAADLGASIIGFTSFSDDAIQGTYGLEKYYDHLLRRDTDIISRGIFTRLFTKREEKDDTSPVEKKIQNEASLVTTIEPNVQRTFHATLGQIAETHKAEYAAGIIMDPTTGEIVAMAQSDDINLQNPRHFRNHNIEDRLEFGSILKPLTVAIGLESGAITRDFSYNDTGSVVLNTRTISNFDKQGRGAYTTLQSILTNSLNTGVIEIALRVGMKTFRSYVERLGLPYETGIDLPYESYGLTNNLNSNRQVDLATASFGQGIAVTPIEALRAFATLSNGGKTVTPYVTEYIEYGSLVPTKQVPIDSSEQVFSDNTVRHVNSLLANITEQAGTFRALALPYHHVAIKTGTAQVAKPEGGYFDDKFLHSMVGHVPAHAAPGEQSYVMIMYVMDPKGVMYSSTTLKEPFFNTVQYLVDYFNLVPDKGVVL